MAKKAHIKKYQEFKKTLKDYHKNLRITILKDYFLNCWIKIKGFLETFE